MLLRIRFALVIEALLLSVASTGFAVSAESEGHSPKTYRALIAVESEAECANSSVRMFNAVRLAPPETATEPEATRFFHSFDNITPSQLARSRAASVGRLEILRYYPATKRCALVPCTGALINSEYLLTAYHCIAPRDLDNAFVSLRAKVRFNYEPQYHDNGQSYWIEMDERAAKVALVDKYADRKQDIVVLRLERGEYGLPERSLALNVDLSQPAYAGTLLEIVGYPYGLPLQQTTESCNIVSATSASRDTFIHNCGKADGLSGAPIFRKGSKDIVGVHTDDYTVIGDEDRQLSEALAREPSKKRLGVGAWLEIVNHRAPTLLEKTTLSRQPIPMTATEAPKTSTGFKLPQNQLDLQLTHYRLGQTIRAARDAYGNSTTFYKPEPNVLDLRFDSMLHQQPFRITQRYRFGRLESVQWISTLSAYRWEDARANCEDLFYWLRDEFRRRLSDRTAVMQFTSRRTESEPSLCTPHSEGELADVTPLDRWQGKPPRAQIKFDDLYRTRRPEMSANQQTDAGIDQDRLTYYACNRENDAFFVTLDASTVTIDKKCSVQLTTYAPWKTHVKP